MTHEAIFLLALLACYGVAIPAWLIAREALEDWTQYGGNTP